MVAMVLLRSRSLALGSLAPTFQLPGVDGQTHDLESFAGSSALVVIFTCNHCPYAKAYEERFVQLQQDYHARGVKLIAISSNDATNYPEDSFAKMKERSEQSGFNFPYLYDETQAVAKAYDAVCTPDIYLFDGERKLRYHGRVDDQWRDANAVKQHDLRRAIDAVLEDREIDFEVFPAMGCSIKWKG